MFQMRKKSFLTVILFKKYVAIAKLDVHEFVNKFHLIIHLGQLENPQNMNTDYVKKRKVSLEICLT